MKTTKGHDIANNTSEYRRTLKAQGYYFGPPIEQHQRGGYDCSERCDSSDVRHIDDAPPRRATDPDTCDTCGGHWEPCYYRCIGPDAAPMGRPYLDDFGTTQHERALYGLESDADVETALARQRQADRRM